MRRAAVVAAAAVVLVSALLAWEPWRAEPPIGHRASADSPPPPAAAPPAQAPPSQRTAALAADAPTRDGGELVGVDAERLARIRADARFNDRARQQTLAAAADARWNEAVDRGGYTAEDFDPGVRDLFRQLMLEPRYAEDGRIEGLVIQSMAEDHPLARLGFRTGDRIDRIQGVLLRDPAEIPSLLARLGTHITFCADREEAEFCREVVLE